ncbi:hypothetical protein GCM10010530_68510 [Kribbella aluminosa]
MRFDIAGVSGGVSKANRLDDGHGAGLIQAKSRTTGVAMLVAGVQFGDDTVLGHVRPES